MDYLISLEWFSVDWLLNLAFFLLMVLVGRGLIMGLIKLIDSLITRADKHRENSKK